MAARAAAWGAGPAAGAARTPARVPPVVHLRRAKDLADRRFAEPVTLNDLAAAARCSRWHLVRAFRAAYGMTPGEYLSHRRLERAMELLRTTDLTVTDVCTAVSFASLGTFSRRFRELVGVAPTEYRRRARAHPGNGRVPACFVLLHADPATQEKRTGGVWS